MNLRFALGLSLWLGAAAILTCSDSNAQDNVSTVSQVSGCSTVRCRVGSLFARRDNVCRTGAVDQSASSGANAAGLPRGRVYSDGRYFGSFSNRFYGPQYGNF